MSQVSILYSGGRDRFASTLIPCRASAWEVARVTDGSGRSVKFIDQRARDSEIVRIKPFSEPAVDCRKQFLSLGFLAILAPELGEARGSTQFPGQRFLLARLVESLQKMLLGPPMMTRSAR